MRTLGVLFCTTALAAVVLSGCSNSSSSPTSPGTGGNSAPTIYATVDWTVLQINMLQLIGKTVDTTLTGSVEVIKSGTSVEDSTATVNFVLNGIAYPLTWQGAASEYQTISSIPASAVKNGDMVAVTVKIGSTTYADSAVMPGGVTVSNTGSTVSWLTEGNFDEVVIFPFDAQNEPDLLHPVASSVDGSGGMAVKADLTSPVSIPASALTSGQWYEAEVLCQQEHSPFAGAATLSDLHVRNIYEKDFQKP
jgi:hypothetical protein